MHDVKSVYAARRGDLKRLGCFDLHKAETDFILPENASFSSY